MQLGARSNTVELEWRVAGQKGCLRLLARLRFLEMAVSRRDKAGAISVSHVAGVTVLPVSL